ncbi:MAG: Zn-ribbon domain-containing OB-fold protein [Actinobacteria bacterium]|nr:Zn-ribbon domain-containing OB-fold protein [Actinomycetota bacterium]MBV9934150.1 Zn-ribbon domain-containing OB-fold protein [Actinomycetota bacterium]
MTSVPIGPDLFADSTEGPRLLGSRCEHCGVVTFPSQDGCPRCGAEPLVRHELARHGTLWTWTTQNFRPKAPYAGPGDERDFRPFVLGYVELGGEVRVEGHILAEPEDVKIGMPLETVVIPFREDESGRQVLTFAFAPSATTEPLT